MTGRAGTWQHGTLSGYRACNGGGRNACDACRAARTAHAAEYRRRIAYRRTGANDHVDATPARDVVQHLHAMGYLNTHIARLAGVSPCVTWRLSHGADIVTRETSDRIMAALAYAWERPAVVTALTGLVPAAKTWQQVRSLSALGWPLWWQARELGYAQDRLPFDFHNPQVRVATANKVQALYDRFSGTHGFSTAAAEHARRLGWHVPLAYDDDGVLVPDAVLDAVAEARARRARRAERPAEVARLTAQGLTAEQIAQALDITPRTVVRDRARKAIAS